MGRGRKFTGQARERQLRVRMSELEYKALELLAMREKRSVSEVCRTLVNEGTQAREIMPTREELHREGVITNLEY